MPFPGSRVTGALVWAIICLGWAAGARGALETAVRSSGPISADEPGARHVESVLAINPKLPRNLIAASIVFGSGSGIAVYASLDAGRSWTRSARTDDPARVFPGIDPALAFDGEGSAYLVVQDKEAVLWKSTDHGKTWSGRTVVAGPNDRPFVGCDASGRHALAGLVYVSGKRELTVFGHRAADWHPELDLVTMTISHDRGGHFDFPKLFLPAPEKELLNVVSDLLVAPDGRLILALQTFRPDVNLLSPILAATYSTIVSNDGGRSFSAPRRIAEWHTYGHAREGKSLLGLSAGARLAIDTSPGTTAGRLYATWLDVVDGFYQVLFAGSADGGITWSTPIQVNEKGSRSDQSNPAIAVDGQGVVGISWNDRRGDPTDRCYQLFFAASGDGGKTFSSNHRIEDGFTCPIGKAGPSAAQDASLDPVETDYRFKNGGDTQGIVGFPGGGFHLAWINGASGEMQLWSSDIEVKKDAPAVPAGNRGVARRPKQAEQAK